jgi:hypothetical protein
MDDFNINENEYNEDDYLELIAHHYRDKYLKLLAIKIIKNVRSDNDAEQEC